MKTLALKGAATLVTLMLLVGGLLAIGFPGGAATTKEVGSCIADANGNFSCTFKIPKDTLPGEYTLRATGEGRIATGAPTPYPPQEAALNVSNNRLCGGQEALASGTGFVPNSIIKITLERIGPLTFGGFGLGGVAEAQSTIRTLTAKITVVDCDPKVAAAATTPNTSGKKLSQTGVDALRLLAIAGVTLGMGFALVSLGRRRIRKAGN